MQLKVSRDDLYLPTNPHYMVKQVIPESATPMQSAAKVPILVAFEVSPSPWPHPVDRSQRIVRHGSTEPALAVVKYECTCCAHRCMKLRKRSRSRSRGYRHASSRWETTADRTSWLCKW